MFTAVARKAKYFRWGNDAEKGTWFARVGNAAGIPQLSLLLFIFAIPFFALPVAVETLLLQARPALTPL